MTDFISSPSDTGDLLPAQFHEQVRDWLDAPGQMAHWWGEQAQEVDAALEALLAAGQLQDEAQTQRVFRDGDFLSVLQMLNEQLAHVQQGTLEAESKPGQLWVLHRADQISIENLDILRRIWLHYPELKIAIALLSLRHDEPLADEGVQVRAIRPRAQLPQADEPATGRRSLLVMALASLGLGLVGLGVWKIGHDSARSTAPKATSAEVMASAPPVPAASVPEVAASAPASSPASAAISPAASAPVPKAPAAAPAAAAKPAAAPQAAASVPSSTSAVHSAEQASALQWVRNLPSPSWVVVHAQLPSVREAEAFKKGKAALANARIVGATERAGGPTRYLVVTGPFRSLDRVNNYTQRLEWKASARSLSRQDLLTQASR